MQEPQRDDHQKPTQARSGEAHDASHEEYVHEAETAQEASDERLSALIESQAGPERLARELQDHEPADVADTLETLEAGDSVQVLHRMDEDAAAEALAHMELPLARTVLADLSHEEAARLLVRMNPDDAADLLQSLSKEDADAVLRAMPRRSAARLGKLALYAPETAGGLMTTEFLRLRSSATVGEAINRIRERREYLDQNEVYSVFCVDDQGRVEGVLDLRSLLVVEPNQRISEIMRTPVVSLRAETDREEVARAFDRYDYLTLPVIDENRRILGIVTIDDVIDIIREENTEDALKQVGAGPNEAVYTTLRSKLNARLPWLVVNLGTASIAAIVVLMFSDLVKEIEFLAVLMPIIANQAGNAGNQSLAVTLRGLVLGEVRTQRVGPLLLRETVFGLVTGLITGLILGLAAAGLSASGLANAPWQLGVVAAFAMAGALAAGCLLGAGIPILMERLNFDPATASTIFLMMLTDMISFAAFLGLAYLMRGLLLLG